LNTIPLNCGDPDGKVLAYTSVPILRMEVVSWEPVTILKLALSPPDVHYEYSLRYLADENDISAKSSVKVAYRHKLQQINQI
jgi:hypothetical protein